LPFWQTLIIAAIPSTALLVGFAQATRDLALRRRLEGTDRFLEIAAVANSQPRDGRESNGLSEQVAAIELLASFGRSDDHLREPARAALQLAIEWPGEGPHVERIRWQGAHALERLDPPRRWAMLRR
jgi:hypothetical protein